MSLNKICRDKDRQEHVSLYCEEKCINRCTFIECSKLTCNCGSLCRNRRFQLQQDALVYPFKTSNKGWGLAAGQHIPVGTFVIQYVGEVFDTETKVGKERLGKYKGCTCTYLMKIEKTQLIDPSNKGSLARFINHSCDPNCITRKWDVLGETCVGIFAIKDIKEGEEITFDYQFDCYSTPLTKCFCRTTKCKGYLGVIPPTMSQEKWEKKLDNLSCVICKSVEDRKNNQIILCDDCNRGFHALCLNPHLLEIPKEEWYCGDCKEKRTAISAENAFKQSINPNALAVESQISLEEINKLIKEVDQEMFNADAELKTYTNELKSVEKPDLVAELKAKIAKIERKFTSYSKNFLFFYLLQKKIKKKIKPESPKRGEVLSPRKKPQEKKQSEETSTKPKTTVLPTPQIPEPTKPNIEESKEPKSPLKKDPTLPQAVILLQKIAHEPEKLRADVKENFVATPRGDLQKTQKEELQKELENELRKLRLIRKEEVASIVPAKIECEVLIISSKELENIRLCMNVCHFFANF